MITQGQPETQMLNNVLYDVTRLSQADASVLPHMRFPCARFQRGIKWKQDRQCAVRIMQQCGAVA